ncbi:MAG: acyl-CoA dehydrogenase family protein [Hyphomonadaceae bacterium]
MSESRALIVESAERLFAEPVGDFAVGWSKVAELGFDALLVAESAGGFGGDWADAFAVLRIAGAHAAPLPVGEAVVAAHIAALAGWKSQGGLQTLAPRAVGAADGGRFTGCLEAAPWGADATHIVFDLDGGVARVAVADARVERCENPAGEPRDTLTFDGATVELADAALSVFEAGAFVRTAQIAGALDAALALSIQYANERSQFGKPIGKFQAVQQNLAVFAEEAAAVNSAGQAAAQALDCGDGGFEIAAAKLRANMAASIGAATAHQVHGAIGFTQEHTLQRYTRRLTAWRSEFGGERFWGERIGAAVSARGAELFWDYLATRGDRV